MIPTYVIILGVIGAIGAIVFLVGLAILGIVKLYRHSKIGEWEQVTDDEVIWAWLKNEITDPNHTLAPAYKRELDKLDIDGIADLGLDRFDPRSTSQNHNRRLIFYAVRGSYYLWSPICNHTTWYRTTQVLGNPFRRIHAHYVPAEIGKPTSLDGIVLWGHNKSGPFVVLEGNHRWHARNRRKLNVATIYIGISITDVKYSLHAIIGCKFCKSGV